MNLLNGLQSNGGLCHSIHSINALFNRSYTLNTVLLHIHGNGLNAHIHLYCRDKAQGIILSGTNLYLCHLLVALHTGNSVGNIKIHSLGAACKFKGAILKTLVESISWIFRTTRRRSRRRRSRRCSTATSLRSLATPPP